MKNSPYAATNVPIQRFAYVSAGRFMFKLVVNRDGRRMILIEAFAYLATWL
jgi:hypothetical protein